MSPNVPTLGPESLIAEGILHAMFAAAPIAIFTTDVGGCVLEGNPAFQSFIGYSAGEIAGLDFLAFTHPEDRDFCTHMFRDLLESGKNTLTYEKRYLRKDGTSVWGRLSAATIRDANGVFIRAVGMINDVSEQKKSMSDVQSAREDAESERLRAEILSDASKRLAESLDFDATVSMILEINTTKMGDWSALGMREGDSGMRLIDFRANPPESEISERVRDTILDAEAPEGIPRVIRSGTSVLYPEVTDSELTSVDESWPIVGTRDPKTLAAVRKIGLKSFMIIPLVVRGKVLGAMSIASARSDRRYSASDLSLAEELGRRGAIALESALLYRDALRTIRVREDFLSVASHELRTPLSPLRMQLEMASLFMKGIPESFAKRSELLELMDGAGRQLDRLIRLVENLLDVSRMTAGRLQLHNEWFDLVPLIREVAMRFETSFAKAGCPLTFELPAKMEGYWDPSRLDQVISNLYLNALKFGAGTPIEIMLRVRNGEAHLSVHDGGPGVDLGERARIFERFERGSAPAKAQGFGLGLYICREILDAHGGKISVEGEPGQGATFVVRLPMRSRTSASV